MSLKYLAMVFAAIFASVSPAAAQQPTFRKVTTKPGLRMDYVLAVADLNGDRFADLLVGGIAGSFQADSPEARFTKTPLRLFIGAGDGSFRYAPELVEGEITARDPIVVAADFTGDGRTDFAVFDAGVYVNGGYGNPPVLWVNGDDGRLRASEALADAVRRENAKHPQSRYSGPADLHLKSASAADVDRDGDVDIWVESTGGANVSSHLMMNNGDGTFELDTVRVPNVLLHNPQPEFWRHQSSAFVDIDNDGDLDLALGQMRDLDRTHINQSSIVLVNDGRGRFPKRLLLPQPAFNNGYTSVQGLTSHDVNGDGLEDLVLVHQRNDDGPAGIQPWTGRFVQVLVNDGAGAFVDETATRMDDQNAAAAERGPDGNYRGNAALPAMYDVDRDGCADIVMVRSLAQIRTDSPLVYRNDGRGTFQAVGPEPFAGSDRFFGVLAVPADVNGDGVVDFVVPTRDLGPDRQFGTADDLTDLNTLVNTTPPQSQRCGP